MRQLFFFKLVYSIFNFLNYVESVIKGILFYLFLEMKIKIIK